MIRRIHEHIMGKINRIIIVPMLPTDQFSKKILKELSIVDSLRLLSTEVSAIIFRMLLRNMLVVIILHLLGVVDLTIALHYIYNSPSDKIDMGCWTSSLCP